MRKYGYIILTLIFVSQLSAQQVTDYVIISAPLGVQNGSDVMWIKWAGSSRGSGYLSPDSGYIYYSKSPGGADLSAYNYRVIPWRDSATDSIYDNVYFQSIAAPSRGTAFRAVDQTAMGPGIYYCIVALPLDNDTLYSNEFQIIVESQNAPVISSPTGMVDNLTPVFSWNANAGVPYYHVILSDEAIKIDNMDSSKIDLSGVSIVWQAITPDSRIAYGAPDPSGIITADPPPLSPGQQYTWVVLNNFGNHPAFSSMKLGSIGEFSIDGIPLKKPECRYPVNEQLNSIKDSVISFTWGNLDSEANTYKLYVYAGSEYEGIGARIIVWQTEVMATDNSEIMSLDVNARSILTTNKYTWRVVAVDKKGAGTAGNTAGFHYEVPSGKIKVHTREIVSINDSTFDTVKVGLAEIKVQVLDGSMENPLFFYTDTSGNLSRERPVGTYRITPVIDGFEEQSRTVIVQKDRTNEITFYLQRPRASIYGKVVDQSGKGINRANVTGNSDQNDSVHTKTDGSGNFVLNCSEADWLLNISINGYKTFSSPKIKLISGQNYNYGTVKLENNPFTLSGTVKNPDGQGILGASVKLFKGEILVDEIASTPQSGMFSFSLASGNYTLKAQKAGFSFYTSTIDIITSMQHNITMTPGASLVKGSVYGKSWSGEKFVYAPITNANVEFINISTNDTFTVNTDAVYGDYKISLPGDEKFLAVSHAQGFVNNSRPCTLSTKSKTNISFIDTLHMMAMIGGTVVNKESGSPAGNTKVTLLKIPDNQTVASGLSALNGYFEINGVPDGVFVLRAGKDGYVLDSLEFDTVKVDEGRPDRESISVFIKPGDKSIVAFLDNNEKLKAFIKIREPFVKEVPIGDTLRNAGSGRYLVSVDAETDSIVDLAEHIFTIEDSETVHREVISLPVVHNRKDTLVPQNGDVKIVLRSGSECDSAEIYYKNSDGVTYRSAKIKESKKEYLFSITPPKDGSLMHYYFKVYMGSDVYGHEKEVYKTYIAPDRSMLTHIEIQPVSNDTLTLPSSYQAKFSFRGYYSSSFIMDSTIKGEDIIWKMANAQGCRLAEEKGLDIVVKTGKNRTTEPVILTAAIDTSKIRIKGNLNSVSVPFKVSGSELKHIYVKRIDAGSPNPLIASSSEKAEFMAEGEDMNGNRISIFPKWSVKPPSAGEICSQGIFYPDENFAGNVRIFAQNENIIGEYNNDGKGLIVQYMIRYSMKEQTVSNGRECSITFPVHSVKNNEYGILSISTESMKNRVRQGIGNFKVIDSVVVDIEEMNGIRFSSGSDSVRLYMNIPEHLQRSARSGGRKMYIACWDEDSLKWDIQKNSVISDDGKTIHAGLTHFSRYAIVSEQVNSSFLKVSPNPFSPFVRPKQPENTNYGTCIEFQIESSSPRLHEILLRIYNITGDIVWSLSIQNAETVPYAVWWDGRTNSRENTLIKPGNVIVLPQGKKMCRNGRYFIVLTAKDTNGKQRQMMKQIVLMK